MTALQKLREIVAAREAETAAIRERITAAQRELKGAADRAAKETQLRAEIAAAADETHALRTQNTAMQELVDDTPTETQVLKLERRVEQLKEAIARVEHETEGRRPAITAYRARNDRGQKDLHAMLAAVTDFTEQGLAAVVAPQVAHEATLAPTTRVYAHAATMGQIASEREAEVGELQSQIDAAVADCVQQSERLREHDGAETRALQALDAATEVARTRIMDAWRAEHARLTAAYDTLLSVNRENQYHLGRGTHVKRTDTAVPYARLHEAAMSQRQGRLAHSFNDVLQELTSMTSENAFSAKQLDVRAAEARAQQDALEAQLQEARGRAEVARAARVRAEEEGAQLRAMRWDLQEALRTIRDVPLAVLPRPVSRNASATGAGASPQ